jgi:hypothetical protein
VIVNIPFEFDDKAIEEKLRYDGEMVVKNTIREMVRTQIISKLPKKRDRYWNDTKEVDWNGLMEDMFKELLEEHIKEAVDEAAVLLAKRVENRKAWKELVAEYHEGGDAQ